MRRGGFFCFPCSSLRVPYLWTSLGSSLVFNKLLLLIKKKKFFFFELRAYSRKKFHQSTRENPTILEDQSSST